MATSNDSTPRRDVVDDDDVLTECADASTNTNNSGSSFDGGGDDDGDDGNAVTTTTEFQTASADSSSPLPPPEEQQQPQQSEWIDNSRLLYLPIRLSLPPAAEQGELQGDDDNSNAAAAITLMVRPEVLVKCPGVLADVREDFRDCLRLVPSSARKLLLRTKIWINLTYRYGPVEDPRAPSHTTTHHHASWLLWAHDDPRKTLSIEVYDAEDYRRMRLHWNGCGLLLHEFCHLVHQCCLPDGLGNSTVAKAYETAKITSLYDVVRRRDWAGKPQDFDLAYAMVDCKEFFSELSVAYWSRGYGELDQADRNKMEECSPPIIEPNVAARIRRRRQELEKNGNGDAEEQQLASVSSPPLNGNGKWGWIETIRILFFRSAQEEEDDSNKKLCHCNKSYPFTRGQLGFHDPGTYETMRSLWEDVVANWDDPYDRTQEQQERHRRHPPGLCEKAPGCFCFRPCLGHRRGQQQPLLLQHPNAVDSW